MSNGPDGMRDLLGGGGEGLAATGPGPVRASEPSPCDQGEEKDVAFVQVRQGQRVNLRVVLCSSPFRVRVFRDRTVLFDQANVQDEVNVPVEDLTPGAHSLGWTFLASNSTWKTRSEVSVDGNVEFCLRKGSDSRIPSNQLVVFLRVT